MESVKEFVGYFTTLYKVLCYMADANKSAEIRDEVAIAYFKFCLRN
jgi:hypothetical protein